MVIQLIRFLLQYHWCSLLFNFYSAKHHSCGLLGVPTFQQSNLDLSQGNLKNCLCFLIKCVISLYDFCDADKVVCPTTRGCTRVFVFFNVKCICLCSKKQPSISWLSYDVKCHSMALSVVVDTITWLTFMLQDIDISLFSPP